ncbi:hypothetical protein [Peptoclostridium litorale]|nr:hypothetical protein [Peptoclostridium litorale]
MIDDIEEIFRRKNLADKDYLLDYETEYLTQYVFDNYFDEADIEIGYRKEDIEDILRFYAFKGEKPAFIEFKEKYQYDLKKVAEYICYQRMDPYGQAEYISKLWDEKDSKWKQIQKQEKVGLSYRSYKTNIKRRAFRT